MDLAGSLENALASTSPPPVVLIDSLDSWVGNLLQEHEDGPGDVVDSLVEDALEKMLKVFDRSPASVILVSSEVGLTLVPPFPLGRRFQDLLGLVNQKVAAAAHLANPSASPESEKEWMTLVATWPLSFWRLLADCAPDGSFSKTYRDCSQAVRGETSPESCEPFLNTGILHAGESSMLNTLASRSDAVESSLSAILETGDLPQRFFLSAKACAGILRRAKKRGRKLPEPLRLALERVARTLPPTEPQAGT